MVLLLGVLFLIPVSAFGISTPYMKEVEGVRIYEAYQNNVEDFIIVLQSGTEEPMNVQIEIIEGSEVIELMEENNLFLVNPGEKVPVQFRIVSPPGAQIGDKYSVRVSFSSSEVGEGALAFSTSIEKSFDVLLVELPIFTKTSEPEDQRSKVVLIIFIAIIVLLVFLIILIKVKKTKKQSSIIKSESKTKVNKKENSLVKKKAVKKKK